jgi:ABC-2 type transport system permease protein
MSFGRVVRAEWGKLFALRSTWVLFLLVAVLIVGSAGAIGGNARGRAEAPSVGQALLGVDMFSLVLGVFGIMMVTGEYGSGLIRATFAAVPRRLPVLGAKAVVLVGATLPLMSAVCFTSVFVEQAFLPAGRRVGLGDDGVLRALLGASVAPVALALLGLGLGALLRHTAVTITVYVVTVLVLPALLRAALPESLSTEVVRLVPVAAAQAMYSSGDNPFKMLSPGPAALVTLGWVVVVLAAGGSVLWRRDP